MAGDVDAELAAFEGLWLRRFRNLAGEARTLLMVVAALCSDKPTVQGIIRGDPAARAEILRTFRQLSDLCGRLEGELQPVPLRFQLAAKLLGRAFTSFEAAAVRFEAATDLGLDFDALAGVSQRLDEGGRFLERITEGPKSEPAKKPPARRGRQRRTNGVQMDD